MVSYMAWKTTHVQDAARQIAISLRQSLSGSPEARGVEHAVWCINGNGGRNLRGSGCALTALGEKRLTGKRYAKNVLLEWLNQLLNTTNAPNSRLSMLTVDGNANAADSQTQSCSIFTTLMTMVRNIGRSFVRARVEAAEVALKFIFGLNAIIIRRVSAYCVSTAIMQFMFLAIAPTSANAAPDTITSSVCFQDPQGNCLASGVITFDLNTNAKVIAGGQVAPLHVSVTLTSAGVIPGGTVLYGNDQLQPAGTYYNVRIYNSNGLLVSGSFPLIWVISGASPVDLSLITASSGSPDPGLANPVLQNPLGNQTITQPAATTFTIGGSGTYATTSAGTHSGTETFANVNSIINAAQQSGSDIGAKINNACASASGQTVWVPASSAGSFSTAILFNVTCRITFDQGLWTYTGSGTGMTACSTGDIPGIIVEGSGTPSLFGSTRGTGLILTNTAANGMDFQNCDNLVLRNFTIVGPNSGTGIGMQLSGNGGDTENVAVYHMGGDCMQLNGTRAQANNWQFRKSFCTQNGGKGFNTFGANANNATFDGTQAQQNGGCDYSISTFSNTFVGTNGTPPTAGPFENRYCFVGGTHNTGWIYSENPGGTDVSFDATSNYNFFRLMSGTVVSDSGTGNQYCFMSSNGAVPASCRYYQNALAYSTGATAMYSLHEYHGQDDLATQIIDGIFHKSGTSPRDGYTIRSYGSLNLISDANQTGVHDLRLYQGCLAADITTCNPSIDIDGSGNVQTPIGLNPGVVNTVDVGSTTLPYRNLFLGTAATNNFKFQPASTAAARTVNLWDFGANGPPTQNYPGLTILTSQYTNSTTGFTNVAGGNTLQFPVLANTTYTATCHLYYQAAATGGLNIEFTGPASPTTVIYGLNDPSAATTFNGSVATAYSTSLGQVVTTAATNFDAIVSFALINGANAGTVNLLAKSSAAVQLQIQAGSFCRVQ